MGSEMCIRDSVGTYFLDFMEENENLVNNKQRLNQQLIDITLEPELKYLQSVCLSFVEFSFNLFEVHRDKDSNSGFRKGIAIKMLSYIVKLFEIKGLESLMWQCTKHQSKNLFKEAFTTMVPHYKEEPPSSILINEFKKRIQR